MTNQEFIDALLDLQDRIERELQLAAVIGAMEEIFDANKMINLALDLVAAERLANSDWLNPEVTITAIPSKADEVPTEAGSIMADKESIIPTPEEMDNR